MTSWHSPQKIYNLGHPYLARLFTGPVNIEEKVDGSFFQFGIFDGQVKCRSKGSELILDAPEKMFQLAVDTVQAIAAQLHPGWTYRGEYLQKPKHNALAYDRVPRCNIVIFDIMTDEERYLPYCDKFDEATRLGLEVVPNMRISPDDVPIDSSYLKALLDQVSLLGGQKVEGVVIKNYTQFGPDGKALMGKYVSEEFKEIHKGEWKKDNPTKADVLEMLCQTYKTPARWNKAIQHLKEAGKLTSTPKDIGVLIKEVQNDVMEECSDEIKMALFNWAKPQILRAVIAGLPEWYKHKLFTDFMESRESSPVVGRGQTVNLLDDTSLVGATPTSPTNE